MPEFKNRRLLRRVGESLFPDSACAYGSSLQFQALALALPVQA